MYRRTFKERIPDAGRLVKAFSTQSAEVSVMMHFRPRLATTGTSQSASELHAWYDRTRTVVCSDRSRIDGGGFGAGLRWGLSLSLPVWFALFFIVLY